MMDLYQYDDPKLIDKAYDAADAKKSFGVLIKGWRARRLAKALEIYTVHRAFSPHEEKGVLYKIHLMEFACYWAVMPTLLAVLMRTESRGLVRQMEEQSKSNVLVTFTPAEAK